MNHRRPSSPSRQTGRSRGFTLVELMITVMVLALLLAMAVPSFSRLAAANRLATQTNELVAALNLARMEAVRRAQSVSIRSKDDNANFHEGWTIFPDTDSDGAAANANDVFRVNPALTGTTTITRVKLVGTVYSTSDEGDKGHLVFSSRGTKFSGGQAFFRVCDSGNTAIPGRIVRVLTAGTISLISTTASCS